MIGGTAVDGRWRRKSSSKLSSSNHRRTNKKRCDSDLATSSTSTDVVQKLSQELHDFHVTHDEPIRGLKPINLFTSKDSDVNSCDLEHDEETMNEDDFARAKKQGQMPQQSLLHTSDDSDFDDIDDDDYIEALRSCQKQKNSAVVFKTESSEIMNEGSCLETRSTTEQHSRRKRSSQQFSSDEGLVLGGVVMENRETLLGLTAEQLKRIEENRHNALEKRRLSKLMQQQKQSTSVVANTFNTMQSNSSMQSLMTCQTEKPHLSSINDSNDFIDDGILDDINDEDIRAIDVDALLRSRQKQNSAVVKTEVPNADGDTFGQSTEAAKSSGTIDGGVALGLFQLDETEHATKGSTPVPKRRETLTQIYHGEKTTKKAKTSQCIKDQAGNIVSVVIEKPILFPHTELITFQRGDVWVWISDDGIRFAYKLGYFHHYDKAFHAVIDEIWMDLDYTYIGPNPMNTSIKERFGDWVLLEKGKHLHMPPNERIKLKTLVNKLDHAQEPLITYIEEETTVSYSYRPSTPNQTVSKHNYSDRPVMLELFAGAGGATVGFGLAGWYVKYKVEMNATCCKTLITNFEGRVFQVDVAKLLPKLDSIDRTMIVWIHGSPPCQGFSTANTGGGINDRQNKGCTQDFLEIVAYIQPIFVSMENVPGLDSKRRLIGTDRENRAYLQTVIATLLSLGYNVSKTITMASNFGDPQDRKRLVLFASKQGYMLPTLVQTHGVGTSKGLVTAGDVRDLEDIKPNCDGRIIVNGKTVEGHFRKYTEYKSISDNDLRLNANEPAGTLTKKNKIVHYKHDRYLTLLECKRLMSFPDDHVICGKKKEIRDQIGNAVPCRFAEAIGKAVMRSYRSSIDSIE